MQNTDINTKRTPLRVGFDLDGVLLYNPARIVRPLISFLKDVFSKQRNLRFYYPKSSFEKFLWKLFHKSSLFNASGIQEIKDLVHSGQIEAHLITGRYSFLGKEVKEWIKKNHFEAVFTSVFYNEKDEQPHLFKERKIKELQLTMYVEDNFDIVHHLSKKTPAHIIWVYNLFDRGIPYAFKVPTLKQAVCYIQKQLVIKERP